MIFFSEIIIIIIYKNTSKSIINTKPPCIVCLLSSWLYSFVYTSPCSTGTCQRVQNWRCVLMVLTNDDSNVVSRHLLLFVKRYNLCSCSVPKLMNKRHYHKPICINKRHYHKPICINKRHYHKPICFIVHGTVLFRQVIIIYHFYGGLRWHFHSCFWYV